MARRYRVYREPTLGEYASHEIGYHLGARFGCLRLLAMPVALVLWIMTFFGLSQGKAGSMLMGIVLGVLALGLSRWIFRRPRGY